MEKVAAISDLFYFHKTLPLLEELGAQATLYISESAANSYKSQIEHLKRADVEVEKIGHPRQARHKYYLLDFMYKIMTNEHPRLPMARELAQRGAAFILPTAQTAFPHLAQCQAGTFF